MSDRPLPDRLVIADPGLTGPVGHHLSYSQAVAEAALARGIPALILGGAGFAGPIAGGAIPFRPVFRARFQTSGGGGPLRRAIFATTARMPSRLAAPVAPTLRAARRALRRPIASPDTFGAELARALDEAGGAARDLVLLHSMSAANLAGLAAALAPEALGALAVVLRRTSAEMDRDDRAADPIAAVLDRLGRHFGPRLRLFADTDQLAAMFGQLVAAPVRTVPPPVLVPQMQERPAADPPHLVFPGGARAEKGYPLLPTMVERLRGKARFTIHSGKVDGAADPIVQAAHRAVRSMIGPELDVIERPLPPDEYTGLLVAADLLLLPYDAAAYGPRSSGILAEARALGLPAVVPVGCWMESAAGPAAAVAFDGPDDFLPAVERALRSLPALTAALRAAAPAWRRAHAPEALLDQFLTPPD